MFCAVPAGVLWLCRKYPIFDKIGPVMILYAIGVVIANIPMPAEMVKLTKAAEKKNMSPVEYLLFLIEVSTHPEKAAPIQH